jgi:putative membrane protein
MQTVENRFIWVVSIIYVVGIAGFLIPELNPLFLKLTPWNLIAAFVIAWIFHKKWELSHVLTILGLGVAGFFVEFIGVKTGVIFGSYSYGSTLGAKWQGTPYLIGLNWAALILYTSSIFAGAVKSNLGRSLLGAAIMTLYDFFMEPVAMKYDFWDWKDGIIPIQNYVAWFLIALVFHLILNAIAKPIRNRMAASLFYIQFGFFLILFLANKFL